MRKAWLVITLLLVVLMGCQTDQVEENDEADTDTDTSEVGEDTTYTVTDDLGDAFTFEEVPETVVSLTPSNTEILFALGQGDKVVGVTEYDNYPEEALDIENVSDALHINEERIIELDPDVIFAYTIGNQELLQSIKAAGIPVFVISDALTIDDVYNDIIQIAEVMGVEEQGEALVQDIQAEMEEVEQLVNSVEETPSVYFEISPSPDIYTIGANTFQQAVLEAAGVENVFGDVEGWIPVNEEDVVERNPDIIITTVNFTDDPEGEIMSRSGWSGITAVENGEVFLVDSDIMSRPGPRIGQAVRILAETVYPELTNE
ncbi:MULTISPECIES: ABC transporter substrate-binding protein [Bacillaceae]|uniref:ABC transporter substrate-binding protein n=1 Tax=Evansella alkalicola TaxID=745819 RepID=A0ABS6JR40_9BACI|nr:MULTISPECIES: ABC transporter substrate-binding protein [Bacillaceae]MBU9721028.1 ABC transporter substrate-binding protein [Bacillus alkalicola]